MRDSLKQKIIAICDKKIASKGDNVGLSFYAFFANKNDDPQLLLEAATWWIKTHKLDHFEKALKIKQMVETENSEPLAVGPKSRKEIGQGDIFWIQSAGNDDETELGQHTHPYVVVQDNLFNQSRIHTVIVCALTTNLKKTSLPGNILLDEGEANLPKQSVIEVSKISSIARIRLGDYIGSLSQQRINQVLAGLQFLQTSSFTR